MVSTEGLPDVGDPISSGLAYACEELSPLQDLVHAGDKVRGLDKYPRYTPFWTTGRRGGRGDFRDDDSGDKIWRYSILTITLTTATAAVNRTEKTDGGVARPP